MLAELAAVPNSVAERFFPPSFHVAGRKTILLTTFSAETLLARMLL
jgi:hypothetical protein